MRVWIRVSLLVVLASGTARAETGIHQAELLRRLIDVERLTTPPAVGEQTRMFSSHDRRSRVADDGQFVAWDANDDCGQYLGQAEDGWRVLMDVEGPGAITRLWCGNAGGQVRFELDGAVVLEAAFDELLSGRKEPFLEPLVFGGATSYVPMGFAQRCRVLAERDDLCYEINCVRFPADVRVQTFAASFDAAAQAAAADVAAVLERGLTERALFGGRRTMPVAVFEELGPGEQIEETLAGAGTVRALYVALTERTDPRESYALHRCVLRVFFDGSAQPQVEAPLCDFFGSGFDLTPFNALVIGTNRQLPLPLPDRRFGQDRFMYCLFPMPYRDGLRVEIENRGTDRRPIGLLLHMRVDTQPPAEDALRFFARYRCEDPCAELDFAALALHGRGRVVGLVLNVDCPRASWWGTGDHKIWIDGDRMPSYFGTSTDAFFGTVGRLTMQAHALSGVTRSGRYGKTSAYRLHLADCVNFQRQVAFGIENIPEGGVRDTYYGSLVYWYAEPDAKHFFEPLDDAALAVPGLRMPGAVEIEDNLEGSGWGNELLEKHAGGEELSGGRAAVISTPEPVTVNLTADRARVAWLGLRTHPRRPFETIRVQLADGVEVGTVTYRREAGGLYAVGTVRLAKGRNALRVTCPQSAVLDCWVVRDPEVRAYACVSLEAEDVQGGQLVRRERPEADGGAAALLVGAEPGAQVTWRVPVPCPGRYRVAVEFTAAEHEPRVQPLLGGVAVGAVIDVAPLLAAGAGRVELGLHELRGLEALLTLRLVPGASAEGLPSVAVNRIVLEPVE